VADRIRLDRPVVVEGKYDKIRLQAIVDADILTTDGFGIFKAKEKTAMLRRIAAKNGILVLTDSDGGGLVIRNYFNAILPKDKLTHLYIPAIKGREKRKTEDSKEGLLGVEGMDTAILRELFAPFAVDAEVSPRREPITKVDLYEDGLSGGAGSKAKRVALCRAAGLPLNISADAMLTALNLLYGREEYKELLKTAVREIEAIHETAK
jgi:ribonuclease M5